MANLKTFSVAAQVAVHLREELCRGRWNERMPGRDHLANELGVSPRSVQGALDLLEKTCCWRNRVLAANDGSPKG